MLNNQINPGDTIVVPLELSQPGIAFIEPVTRVLSDLAFSAAALDSLRNNLYEESSLILIVLVFFRA